MVIPPVRIHDELGLDSHEYVLKVRGTEVARGRHHGRPPARDGPRRRGRPAARRRADDRARVRPAGDVGRRRPARARPRRSATPSSTRESVIVTHLTETIRAHAAELLTRQDVAQLLDQLKEANAAVVEEVVPDVLTLGEIQRVLQALLARGRLDPRPRRDRRGGRRQGARHARPGAAGRVRAPGARAHDHRAAPRRASSGCARSRSIRPSSRRSPARSRRPPTASTSRWSPTARAGFGRRTPNSGGARASRAAAGRCCSARRACAATCGGSCEQAIPQLAVCSYNEIAPGISVETIGVIDG